MMDFASAHPEVHINILPTPTGDTRVLRWVELLTHPVTEGMTHATISHGIKKSLKRVQYCLEGRTGIDLNRMC